ncbi:MAG: hypothetical protein R2762_29110 [Bryobacteraceae bacterium]
MSYTILLCAWCVLLCPQLRGAEVRILAPRAPVSKGAPAASDDGHRLTTPMAGYHVVRDSLQVRGILGVPGANYFSEPYPIPDGVAEVRIASGHNWLLALRGIDAHASAWVPERGVDRPLVAVRGVPALVAFSSDGAAAAFYMRDADRAVVYRGLPDKPELAVDLDATNWPDDLRLLAVAENGRLLAGATGSGQVLLLGAGGSSMRRLLLDGQDPAALAFDGGRLALFDATSGRVLLVEAPLQGTAARVLAVVGGNARDATLSGGGGKLQLAAPGTGLVAIDIDSNELSIQTTAPFVRAELLRWPGHWMLAGPDRSEPRIHSRNRAESYLPAVSEPGGQE